MASISACLMMAGVSKSGLAVARLIGSSPAAAMPRTASASSLVALKVTALRRSGGAEAVIRDHRPVDYATWRIVYTKLKPVAQEGQDVRNNTWQVSRRRLQFALRSYRHSVRPRCTDQRSVIGTSRGQAALIAVA